MSGLLQAGRAKPTTTVIGAAVDNFLSSLRRGIKDPHPSHGRSKTQNKNFAKIVSVAM